MKNVPTYLFALAALIISTLIISCKDKEVLPPAIFVSPQSTSLNADASDLIEFVVSATAGDNALSRVVITQKPLGGVTTTLKDTLVSGREVDFYYVYVVPEGASQYLLTFTIYDSDGYSATVGRALNVASAAYLTETTGYEIVSPWNFGGNDGFNIASLATVQLDAGGDSTLVDLTEYDDLDDNAPSHILNSLSGIKFVRNNAYNYPQATAQSAANSYTSSTPVQLVTNIAVNDILIAEYDTIQHKYAVIKIAGVMDDAGVALDRYIFNVKK
ncbi:MAG: hypothetical protein ACKVOK_00775 [Flavobacteriales bacterium]